MKYDIFFYSSFRTFFSRGFLRIRSRFRFLANPDSEKKFGSGKKTQIRNTDHKCQVIMMMIITVIIMMITVIMMTDDYLPEVGQAVQPYCLGKGAMMRPRRKNDDHNSDNDD